MGAQPRHATDSLGTPWDGPATLSDSAGSLCRPLQASAKMSLPQIEGPLLPLPKIAPLPPGLYFPWLFYHCLTIYQIPIVCLPH